MTSVFTANSLTTPGGIQIKPMDGYPTLMIDESGAAATEKYLIHASDVLKFYAEAMGNPQGFLLYRTLPLRLAARGLPMVTRSMSFEPEEVGLPGDPFSADTRSNVPPNTYCHYYVVTIEYSASVQDPGDEHDPSETSSQAVHTVTSGGQSLTISPHKITLHKQDLEAGDLEQDADGDVIVAAADKDGNDNLLQPIVKLIPTSEHTIKLGKLEKPRWETYRDAMGTVNDGRITKIDKYNPLYRVEKETVMFAGLGATQTFTLDYDADTGTVSRKVFWEIELRMTQRRVKDGGKVRGWNHVWSPKHQRWTFAMQTMAGGKLRPLFKTSDFDDLLEIKEQQ